MRRPSSRSTARLLIALITALSQSLCHGGAKEGIERSNRAGITTGNLESLNADAIWNTPGPVKPSKDKDIDQRIVEIPLPLVKDVRDSTYEQTVTSVITGADRVTTEQKRAAVAKKFADIVAFDPNAGTLYPGALIRGRSIGNGLLDPILANRSGGIVTVENIIPFPDSAHPRVSVSATLHSMTNSEVKNAVNTILRQKLGETPADINFYQDKLDSYKAAMLQIGASASWASGSVDAAFNKSAAIGHSALIARLVQRYYTVTYARPHDPRALFAEEVKWKDIKDQMGPNDPPAYVASIVYGRQMLLRMESSFSYESMNRALSANVSGFGWKAGLKLSADDSTVLKNSNIVAYVTGGSATNAAQLLPNATPADIAAFLKNGADFDPKTSPAQPLTYMLRYVRENEVARLAYSEDYNTTRESRKPLDIVALAVNFWTLSDDKDGDEGVWVQGSLNGTPIAQTAIIGQNDTWGTYTSTGPHPFATMKPFSSADCKNLDLLIHKNPDNGESGSGWNLSFSVVGKLGTDAASDKPGETWVTVLPQTAAFSLGDKEKVEQSFRATCPF
jgi:hypothetical protein